MVGRDSSSRQRQYVHICFRRHNNDADSIDDDVNTNYYDVFRHFYATISLSDVDTIR